MVIKHNMTAENTNRYNNMNNKALSKSMEKLASGYKINRAGDNAAGLAVSEKMRAQSAGLTQAVANAEDGISMIQTFEGALNETHKILNRMKTLATQSANGIYSEDTDRAAIELEYEQLTKELNDIAATDFNGVAVLSAGADIVADGKESTVDSTDKLQLASSVKFQVGSRTKDLKTYDFDYTNVYTTLGGVGADPDGTTHLSSTAAQQQALGTVIQADMDVTATGLGLTASSTVNLSTQYTANQTIDKIDFAINKTSLVRAQLGALDNRLNHKIDNLNVTNENIMSAESRIRDTNVADEVKNLSKTQILAQASQAMLAQANQLPSGVLGLLQ
ncbi:MAG: flagellin [Ruminococcus sp.]|jgi:flagellin|nr:flagellin [Ruminococcus sp.]